MLFEHIANASDSLKRNRGRSFLTAVGIAIGVASVTAILALSAGVTRALNQQITTLDSNLIIVRPGLMTYDPNSLTSPTNYRSFNTSTLSEKDVDSIRKMKDVNAVAPLMIIDSALSSNGTIVKNNAVVATTPDFYEISNLTMADGEFLNDGNDTDTAIIGSKLAVELFGEEHPVGRTFKIRDQRFTVIGILGKTDNPVNYNNVDLDRSAIINLQAAKAFLDGRSQIQQINVRANTVAALPQIKDDITYAVQNNHGGENDFAVASGKEISTPSNQTFKAITDAMAAIAAISLFVGGIGIMNMLLVGVAERTREIGIRKAVGASNGNIASQFLIESLMISLLGGFFGYLLGYVVAFAISNFLFFNPAVTWETAVAALVMSVVVGVAFGLYPAIRAASKDTIQSLREYR